jgi:hypothetical protein
MKIGKMASFALVGGCLLAGGAVAGDLDDGSFALPQEVVCAATAFQDYMSSAAHIDSGFASGDGVERSLKTGASYQPAQLEEGMIAYGAIAALQDDRFVQGVETAAGRGDQRAAFADRMLQDPYAATQVDGAIEAGQRVEAAISSEAEPLVSVGAQVKLAAYSVQHQAWSKKTVPNPGGRLARVKALSAEPLRANPADSARLYAAMAEGGRRGGPAGPAVTRALAVAALNVLGEPGQGRALMSDPRAASCLRIAKLNLYQCLAAAGPQYEDIFCLGQHAMADTGQCVVEATHPVRVATRASYRR